MADNKKRRKGQQRPINKQQPNKQPNRQPNNQAKSTPKPQPKQQPKAQAKPQTNPQPKPVNKAFYNRKAKSRRKSLGFSVLAFVLVAASLMALVYIIYHLNSYIADKPEQSFVTSGYIEHTVGAQALVVRNESVVGQTAAGTLVTSATEGSHVGVAQNLAMVVPDSLSVTVENLRNTQAQISEIEQELIESGSIVGADSIYSNYNDQISSIINMACLDSMSGNMSDMSSYSSSILVLMDARQNELSALHFNDERLNVLIQDASNYEAQLSNEAAIVKANQSGIVSFKLDGQEETLNYDVLMNSPISDVKDVIENSVRAITSDLNVTAGENVARIASNEEQYLAVYLNQRDIDVAAFAVDSVHTINVPSEGLCIKNCRVIRSSADDNGLLVVFKTTRYVESLLDFRTIDVEVVITETTGMKVPTSALVDADYDRGIATIYLNDDGFCTAVDVYIRDNDREFAIIAPVTTTTSSGNVDVASRPNLSSVFITNPQTIKPGDKIEN